MQQVKRIVDILETLADNNDGISLSELSERVNLPKSTTHRVLKALIKYNMAAQDSQTKKYNLGLEIFNLGNRAFKNLKIRKISRPFLTKLRDQIGETVYLAIFRDGDIICVDKIETENNLRYYVEIGSTMPIHSAAAAKAVMAYQDENTIEEAISKHEFKRYTNFTITDPKELLIEYEKVRIRGYALCNNELEDLIMAIAVPVFDGDNKVNASITTIGLANNIMGNNFENTVEKLKDSAAEMSKVLSKVCINKIGNAV